MCAFSISLSKALSNRQYTPSSINRMASPVFATDRQSRMLVELDSGLVIICKVMGAVLKREYFVLS